MIVFVITFCSRNKRISLTSFDVHNTNVLTDDRRDFIRFISVFHEIHSKIKSFADTNRTQEILVI